MPSVATGANLANHEMLYLGISGDGDTASIGIGQFVHAARRQLNVVYIVENNGTYGPVSYTHLTLPTIYSV